MDGSLKNQPNYVDGNDTTALSPHPYILCRFAVTYTLNMLCVGCVQRRVVEGSGVSSGGCVVVHFDVHGE